MKRAVIVLLILGIFILSSCSGITGKATDSDLSEIDKEIKALQEELKKSEDLASDDVPEDLEDAAKEVSKDSLKLSKKKTTKDTTKLPRLQVKETEVVKLKIEAKDADRDAISYTFSKPLDSRGQWHTTYGDAGEYVVTVTASDKKLKSKKDVLVVVTKKNEPPVIKNIPDITVTEGETVRIKPQVTDVNKDKIDVTITKPVGNDGVWETNHKDAGKHKVVIRASDGVLTSEDTVQITVIDKNVPPVIKGVKDLTVHEGETVKIKPKVSDLDGDKIIVTISDPVGDDGVWETKYTDHGEYKITIKASDGKDTTTQLINLVVKDVNLAPEIISISLE
ncbi:MAG: hypothetical protein KAT43_05005 [Nanoarchaeota archaeon]|nr:hypothetical protein [Nanoarchaeota archaeon]